MSIFSLKVDDEHLILRIFGIKLSLKKYLLLGKSQRLRYLLEYYRVSGATRKPLTLHEQMESVMQIALEHQKTFSPFRYKHYGQDIVICATGPSFDKYIPIENTINIGVNNAFGASKMKFDYLFCADPWGAFGGGVPDEFLSYRGNDCVKFVGNNVPFSFKRNPKEYNMRFYHSANAWNTRIDYLPLPDFTSIVFPAFMFALWTAPRRIYIVGADCSQGHAACTGAKHQTDVSHLVKPWKALKEYAQKNYPEVEIISVNPVGLKGLFKDMYQN